MKKSLMVGVSGFALTAIAGGVAGLTVAASSAEAGNAYIALGAGFAVDGFDDWERTPPPCTPKFLSGDIDLDVAPAFEAAVGYDIGPVMNSVGIRVELQATYLDFDVDGLTFGEETDSGAPRSARAGHITETLLMANVLVDFDLGGFGGITPYAGVGIGIAGGEVDFGTVPITSTSIPGLVVFDDASDTGFVWQLIIGASVPVATNLDVYGNYRLIGLPDLDVDDEFAGSDGPGSEVTFEDEFAHTFTVGMRYNFM